MATILVTGANGRLGKRLVAALVAARRSTRAVVRPQSAGTLPAAVERFEWDLASGPLPARAFEGVSHVVHLAGLVGDHPYGELVRQNAFVVKNLLANCPHEVERAVLASSISVYGGHGSVEVDENFPQKPWGNYGKSKAAGEVFASECFGRLPIVLLRFGMIYGPGFEEGYFDVLRRIGAGKMAIVGDGKNRLPLIHSDDAVDALLLAIEKEVASGGAYNIVGEERPTQAELYSLAAIELGVPAPTKHVPLFLAMAFATLGCFFYRLGIGKKPALDPENVRQIATDRAYSAAKAKRELGFAARVKISQGLKEVVREFLETEGRG